METMQPVVVKIGDGEAVTIGVKVGFLGAVIYLALYLGRCP